MSKRNASRRPLSEAGFRAVARRFQVLGDPLRLKLLHELRAGPRHVGALVEAVGGSQANVSKHLSVLLGAGIVKREARGNLAFYEIADPSVLALCKTVCENIESSLADREALFE